ncbi:MAG: hypothetical protein CMI01_17605 [Oceanospirillaceae bacterium]|nr:hypothetical protein [Oceanospirillaceae bacterium]
MTALRIIGVGSPSGDDRAGWEVIDRLKPRIPVQWSIELIALDRPGSGLVEWLANVPECWLVDAIQVEGVPGRCLQPGLDELLQADVATAGSHGFGLSESLNLAATLGLLPQRLELHCVTIREADIFGQQLSTAVNAGVNGLVSRFHERLVKQFDHTATFKGGVGSLGSSSGSSVRS